MPVNLLAVVGAAVANMVVGMLWYSPAVFGKMWMGLSGLNTQKMNEMKRKGMAKSYLISFAGALVMSYVLAVFLGYSTAANVSEALQVAFWLWLGFIATTMLGSILWESKPTKLYLLNVLHYLISMFVMSVILFVWV